MSEIHGRDLVVGVTPFTEPNAALVVAVERAGGLGVLDLGRDAGLARAELARVTDRWSGTFGVRIPDGCPISPGELPGQVDTVVIDATVLASGANDLTGRRVLAEATSPDEARTAIEHGATGIVAKGMESGGRIGESSAYVLLQRLVTEFDVPVWVQGGIGVHTAAAAIAGGARGVVVDAQLALVTEARTPRSVAAAIEAMDGSETAIVAGHRVFTRPDLPTEELARSGPANRFGGRDLGTQLLPIGQEGALAGMLARRHKTAGGVVQAIRGGIPEHLAAAAATTPLAPGAGIAREPNAPGYPIAQGPMTRVSDQAAFAAAVAGASGLPFLALALMSGEDTRRLLTEAAELLGDRPWGVGILGFAPPEVRDAQLEVIHEVRPPYALIAGGRPSQAAALEAAGISTFLHVPSPGLLARFIKDGARKFIFEGSECGGHIGPRASFPLWESQIETLLANSAVLPEVSVLFAGGVHDARSAAMVAAMCAPLAERGAAAGVLMGTAYLFTEEAVSAGAILPYYQRAAIECDHTAVLETSPGHVTRCADTAYVAAFERKRLRLEGSGVSRQEIWAELERLNLGRLRIAAKGLRRTGEGLASVGEDEQRDDGMFMLGQVATVRSAITDIATLHRQVSADATARHRGHRHVVRLPGCRRLRGVLVQHPRRRRLCGGGRPGPLGPGDLLRPGRHHEPSRQDTFQVGRVHPPCAVRRARIRYPAGVARQHRAGSAARPGGRGAIAARRRVRRPDLRPRSHLGDLRRGGGQRPVLVVRAALGAADLHGHGAAGAGRAPAPAHRGLLSRRAQQRHRRPDRQPPRPRRIQLHGRRGLRLEPGGTRSGLQGTDRGHQ
jgi:NAD(P)H-dependent flavin oxidoreductase YrpB (nitropropane dioxygenase family)